MFKIDRYKSLVHLILLYTVTTLSYTLWPIDAPNKVVGILIFLNVLWVYCDQLNVKNCGNGDKLCNDCYSSGIIVLFEFN